MRLRASSTWSRSPPPALEEVKVEQGKEVFIPVSAGTIERKPDVSVARVEMTQAPFVEVWGEPALEEVKVEQGKEVFIPVSAGTIERKPDVSVARVEMTQAPFVEVWGEPAAALGSDPSFAEGVARLSSALYTFEFIPVSAGTIERKPDVSVARVEMTQAPFVEVWGEPAAALGSDPSFAEGVARLSSALYTFEKTESR